MSINSLNPYMDHMTSVRAFCTRLVEGGTLGLIAGPKGPLVDFDTFGDGEELPPNDLIGPAAFTMSINDHLIVVTVMFGIGTQGDKNSYRLNNAISELVKNLLPTKKIPVIRATDGVKLGTMAVGESVQVLPVRGDPDRNLKFVAVELHSTVTFDLSSDD